MVADAQHCSQTLTVYTPKCSAWGTREFWSSRRTAGGAGDTLQVHRVPEWHPALWDVPSGQAPGRLPCWEITHCLAVLSLEGSILGCQPPQKGTKGKQEPTRWWDPPQNRRKGTHPHSRRGKAQLPGPLPRGTVLC